jgi:hypothetical protein
MKMQKKLKLCADCDNDFYNHGNNSTTGKCWMLENAEPETVYVVGTWTEYPDKNCYPLNRLSCWQPRRGSGLTKWRKPS